MKTVSSFIIFAFCFSSFAQNKSFSVEQINQIKKEKREKVISNKLGVKWTRTEKCSEKIQKDYDISNDESCNLVYYGDKKERAHWYKCYEISSLDSTSLFYSCYFEGNYPSAFFL